MRADLEQQQDQERPKIVSEVAEIMIAAFSQLRAFYSTFVISKKRQSLLNQDYSKKGKVKLTGGLNDRIRQDRQIERQQKQKEIDQKRQKNDAKKSKSVIYSGKEKKYASIGSFDKDFKNKESQANKKPNKKSKDSNIGSQKEKVNQKSSQRNNQIIDDQQINQNQKQTEGDEKNIINSRKNKQIKSKDVWPPKRSQYRYQRQKSQKQNKKQSKEDKKQKKKKQSLKQMTILQREQQKQYQYQLMGQGPLLLFMRKNKKKQKQKNPNMSPNQFINHLTQMYIKLNWSNKEKYIEYYRNSEQFKKIRQKDKQQQAIGFLGDKVNVIKKACTIEGKFNSQMMSSISKSKMSAVQTVLATARQKNRFYNQKQFNQNFIRLDSSSDQQNQNQKQRQVVDKNNQNLPQNIQNLFQNHQRNNQIQNQNQNQYDKDKNKDKQRQVFLQ